MISAYVEFGEYDKAMELFSAITPDHPMYETGLSMDKALQGDFEGALEIIEASIEGVEKPSQLQLGMMTVFFRACRRLGKSTQIRRATESGVCSGREPGG